jgi:hypothetical protein
MMDRIWRFNLNEFEVSTTRAFSHFKKNWIYISTFVINKIYLQNLFFPLSFNKLPQNAKMDTIVNIKPICFSLIESHQQIPNGYKSLVPNIQMIWSIKHIIRV